MWEIAQFIVQVVGALALLVTLFIYYRQLRTMGEQLNAMRQGSAAQNILALANFLQAEDVREARTLVFRVLANKHFTDWGEQEKLAASKVCSSYGVAGVILKAGVMPIEPFVEHWGTSIRGSYEILRPYIREMQKPENAGPQYWSTFEWLYLQAVAKHSGIST